MWELLFLVVSVVMAVPQSQEVVASRAVIIHEAKGAAVECEVSNATAKAITAYVTAVDALLADGSRTELLLGIDAYRSFAGVVPEKDSFIRSHSAVRRRFATARGAGQVQELGTPTVKYVIFEDGSWIGDPAEVQAIFNRRIREKEAYGLISAALRAGLASSTGQDGLRVALDRLNSRDQEDFDQADKSRMRQNLELALAGKLKPTPQEFLEHWILKMEGEWAAANEHSRIKPDK